MKSQLLPLPRLYAIVDAACFQQSPAAVREICEYARELFAGGVRLLQYRDKRGGTRAILTQARELRRLAPPDARLIMNDRPDLCLAAAFDGAHQGQDDLSPAAARAILGDTLWVGVSTHSSVQVRDANKESVDYIAIGPVFPTRSKANPDAVIGLDGVRAARKATAKPLVAIGGINRENCRAVIAAGADSVAVVSALLPSPRKAAQEFLAILGELK